MSENIVKENSENDVPLTKVKGQKKTKVIGKKSKQPKKKLTKDEKILLKR
jgi:hypothetical protein